MTFVINLGIPPLLFAQVLYGRALYTSSDLIAVMWISVIPLLMGCYWLLYKTANRTFEGKPAYWTAAGALVIAAAVGQIYATNMTLMLRPEVWQQMYHNTATGLQAPPHDATLIPRWLTVICGGLLTGGFWIIMHGGLKSIDDSAKLVLKKLGAGFAVVGGVIQLVNGVWVYSVLPTNIQAGLHTAWYSVGSGLWVVGLLLAALVALVANFKPAGTKLAFVGGLTSFLAVAGGVIYRDGIRDVTLLSKGYDVWKRTEASNWSTIGLFLLLFVIGLGVIGWLLSVMSRATAPVEQVGARSEAVHG